VCFKCTNRRCISNITRQWAPCGNSTGDIWMKEWVGTCKWPDKCVGMGWGTKPEGGKEMRLGAILYIVHSAHGGNIKIYHEFIIPPSPTVWHISLTQISEHSLKGAYPSVDWGHIRDIHTVDGVSPMTNRAVGGLMYLHVNRIDGRVVPAVYLPCYRWPQCSASNSDQQPVRFLGICLKYWTLSRLTLSRKRSGIGWGCLLREISMYLHFNTVKVRWFSLIQLLMVLMSLS